jgi:hypothetical protein
MQPLKVRTCSSSPIEAEAIELLRSIDRYQPPPGQKQRVRVRLLERTAPRPALVLWPALVISLLFVAVGASAALGSRWLRHAASETPRAAAPKPPGVASLTARAHSGATSQSAADKSSTAPQSEAQSSGTATVAAAPIDPLPRPESAVRPESITRSGQPSEKVLVFDAMRALRREGHPERAAKLLDEYLRRYPGGSLAEEALALSIEASTALGDPKARSLADRYLAHYPAGRFRAAAERARARFSQ